MDDDELYIPGDKYFVEEVVAKKPTLVVEEKIVAVKKKPTKKQVASTIRTVTAKKRAALFTFEKRERGEWMMRMITACSFFTVMTMHCRMARENM
jgi:hypothetical protein